MGDSGFRCPVYLTTHFFGLGGTQIACAIEAIVCTSTARWPKGNTSRTAFREPTWFMSQLGNGVSVLHSVLLVQPAFIFYMVCFQGFDHFCFDELCKGLKAFLKTLIGL